MCSGWTTRPTTKSVTHKLAISKLDGQRRLGFVVKTNSIMLFPRTAVIENSILKTETPTAVPTTGVVGWKWNDFKPKQNVFAIPVLFMPAISLSSGPGPVKPLRFTLIAKGYLSSLAQRFSLMQSSSNSTCSMFLIIGFRLSGIIQNVIISLQISVSSDQMDCT